MHRGVHLYIRASTAMIDKEIAKFSQKLNLTILFMLSLPADIANWIAKLNFFFQK